MAHMVEFWLSEAIHKIYVKHNDIVYKLPAFLKLPEAKVVIDMMYEKIVDEYSSQIKSSKIATVGEFIKKHFMEYDKTFDVVILGNDEKQYVLFNTEDKPRHNY